MALSQCFMLEDPPSLTDGMCVALCVQSVAFQYFSYCLFVWEAILCLTLLACLNVYCAQVLL